MERLFRQSPGSLRAVQNYYLVGTILCIFKHVLIVHYIKCNVLEKKKDIAPVRSLWQKTSSMPDKKKNY